MDAVENFVGAANQAVAPEPEPEPNEALKAGFRWYRAIGDFLKILFGPAPYRPTWTVMFAGDFFSDGKDRAVGDLLAELIAKLVTDLAIARRTLDATRRECNAELERRRRAEDRVLMVSRHWADAEVDLRRICDAHFALCRRVSTLFDAIAHGDDDHRAWLQDAIVLHLNGMPVPPPRKGKKK